MPELPEVEVTRRGLYPHLIGNQIAAITHDEYQLREPYPQELEKLVGATITEVSRRAKYLLIQTEQGTLLMHLGMTGHLRVLPEDSPAQPHDHFALHLANHQLVRFNDIRRFGLVSYIAPHTPFEQDRHLSSLGPEPFAASFNADYLHDVLHKRKIAIKQALMDNHLVVGVGNIYANEVLFSTGIAPARPANRVTRAECEQLVEAIRSILEAAIAKGGTTIRDFSGADGKQGYFVLNLNVYGHKGEPCPRCGTPIETLTQGQRTTFFCPHCQK
ncbi:MAG: bifunctional DNA-formamidopyrimidine glycosylase/DNA-(apurinic or apyrimidinic site) lyase [Succinivibrio sp.]|nr:bifunctional DNA-formamidopyrimidine glycosylase/DNA-(apurinic or apyrimidinic site) lyase [Succinivibrio sp.]